MTTNKIDLAAIKARCEAATEGPWWHRHSEDKERCWVEASDGQRFIVAKILSPARLEENMKDGTFIAHARTDTPALLKEVERLQKREDEFADLLASANNDVKRLTEYINTLVE